MKHLRFIGYALMVIIVIIVIVVKTGVFNYVIGLSSNTATNLNIMFTAVNATLGLLSFLTLIVYTGFAGELVVADFKPKLYVIGKISDSGGTWDRSVMKDILEEGSSIISLKGEGFVYESARKKWDLEVHNNGNSPATNIEITYIVTAYKNEIVFGIDKCDIKDYYSVKYGSKKETIKIDYLPPNSSQAITVFFMDKFPKADLTIELLKCDDRIFIGKPTRISTYHNKGFDYLNGSNDLRLMLGVCDLETDST